MAYYEGKTIAFSHKGGFWKTRYSYAPTCYGAVDNVMISTNKSLLWEHGINASHNNFYGDQFKSSVGVVSNEDPSAVKLFKALSIKSNSNDWVGWARTNIKGNNLANKEYQLGRIDGFVTKEGNQYSELPRDLVNSNSHLDYVCQLDSLINLDDLEFFLGDFDESGDVGAADLLLFLADFGSSEGGLGDLDLDGSVGASDLLLFLSNFGEQGSELGTPASIQSLFFDISMPSPISIPGIGWKANILNSPPTTPILGGAASQAIFVNTNDEPFILYSASSSWSLYPYNDITPFAVPNTEDNLGGPGSVYIHSYNSDGTVMLGVGGNLTLDSLTELINLLKDLGPEWDVIQLYSLSDPKINGDPMRGNYLQLELTNSSTTPVETYAINVDFENTKLDGSKGAVKKPPKQKASPSSK